MSLTLLRLPKPSCTARATRSTPRTAIANVSRVAKGGRIVCYSKKAEDDRLIEQMKMEASKGDIWENEIIGALTKVAGISIAVAFVVLAAYFSQPIWSNTINSFPQA